MALLAACKGDPVLIPGSTTCTMPVGYEAPELALVSTAAEDADAFFSDDTMPLFDLWIADEDWVQLCQNASDYADHLWQITEELEAEQPHHPYVPAVLSFQGRTYEPVGVRFRGRSTIYAMFYDLSDPYFKGPFVPLPDAMQRCLDRELPRKPSFKISMDEFGLDAALADQQTINLIAREGSDSTYLQEVLAHRLANQFGVDAPRTGHARVCLDGAYEGLFSLVEEADTSRFLRQHFPGADFGGYWKVETDGHQTWSELWDHGDAWTQDYIPKAGTSEQDPGRLRDLLTVGSLIESGAEDSVIEAALQGLLDEDQWLREIALDMVIPDYDGMFGNHKNHLLYDHPERGFVVVPFDKDLAFVDLDEYLGGLCKGDIMGGHPCWSDLRQGPALARWLLDARTEEYLAVVQEFVDDVMVPNEVDAWLLGRAEAMRPWVEADRYYREGSPACVDDPGICAYYTLHAWDWSVEPYLTGEVYERADEVQRQLDGGAPCEDHCDESWSE
jgi:spore coat protein CotH